MIKLNIEHAASMCEAAEITQAKKNAASALSSIKDKSGEGAEWLGWRDILEKPNDALLDDIETLAASIRARADIFIVCGIGGSYLGAKAVIDALKPKFSNNTPEIIYAGHHMGGKYFEQLLDYLDRPNADGSAKEVYLTVISKSGTTLETALSFRVLREWMEKKYPDEISQRITAITSAEGGVLNMLAKANGYKKYVIPDDIGGRFSVLTPVGLLPVAVAGIDIKSLFYGAVSAYERYETHPQDILEYASTRYLLHKKGKTIDVFSTFEPELVSFGGWIQQLLGESEGKKHQGIFPAVAGFSTDLHSIGQFIQEGKRSLIETFIIVKHSNAKLNVPATEGNEDGLNYLSGKNFHEINTKALLGTLEAHKAGGTPVITIEIEHLDAQNMGELIYFFELLAAVYVYCLGVNPFNQPGVEDYKKAMYRLLEKN